MRRGRTLLLGLLAGLLAGCLNTEPVRQSGDWLSRMHPFQGEAGADVVQMDVALLEQPPGDAYLNGELWQTADESGVDLDRWDSLAGNGFRIGQFAGILPDRLQALLTSERS